VKGEERGSGRAEGGGGRRRRKSEEKRRGGEVEVERKGTPK